jgi:hypothetical protein
MHTRWRVVLACSMALLGTVGCGTLRSQRVPSYPVGDSVALYLMEAHPRWELASYRVLSQLRYPILDQRALNVQLDSFSHRVVRDSVDRLAVDLVRVSISPFAFPLRDWRSGAEAFGSGFGFDPRIPGWEPSWDGGAVLDRLRRVGRWRLSPGPWAGSVDRQIHAWLTRNRDVFIFYCHREADRVADPGTLEWAAVFGRCMDNEPI